MYEEDKRREEVSITRASKHVNASWTRCQSFIAGTVTRGWAHCRQWFGRQPISDAKVEQPLKRKKPTTTQSGRAGEERALQFLQAQGLRLEERNYCVARGPSRHGGEIDLIMRDRSGTLVFVEVRSRTHALHGSAVETISPVKQKHLRRTAQNYLLRFHTHPACRFDVVALDGDQLQWLQSAF
jgi:putative endonuclease